MRLDSTGVGELHVVRVDVPGELAVGERGDVAPQRVDGPAKIELELAWASPPRLERRLQRNFLALRQIQDVVPFRLVLNGGLEYWPLQGRLGRVSPRLWPRLALGRVHVGRYGARKGDYGVDPHFGCRRSGART